MSKKYVAWMALGAAVVALTACDDGKSASGEQPVVTLARAEITPVVDTGRIVETPSPAVKRTNVTYDEAAGVFRRGHYQESMELFTSYVAEHANDMQGQYMLGLSAWKSGDHQLAEQALMRAVGIDSSNVKVRTNLARVLLEQGKPDDAVAHIEKAIELNPDTHEVWRVLGNTFADLGRTDEALEAYRQAILRKDTDAWSMNNYGLLLIRLGRYEDALPALARAVELNPVSPVFRNNLGVALENTNKLGSARDVFRAAVQADSTYVKAKISLERVETRLRDQPGNTADLQALAQSFQDTILLWRSEGDQQ